ncbi:MULTISPECIES: caspase family protein [Olivibacter]|uniref:Caspase domain-containing protein n=1 Tax=Olivibacter jilunii TaxID=985016 RepID=A0ABW6B493_9SPHI|nr:caspase family protein [Pseudosphingobacterium sp.]
MPGLKYLFVIAIDEYEDDYYPNLHNAKIDAGRLIKILTKAYGFKLVCAPIFDKRASRANIIEAVNSLIASTNREDSLLIYFAGHGELHQQTGGGYWVPHEATQRVSSWVSNSTLMELVGAITARHILIISDSCFSGTLCEMYRGAEERHYTKIEQMRSRWVLSSGRIEKVSDGQAGAGSPFANALIGFLEKNDNRTFSFSEMAAQVLKVTGISANQQPMFGALNKWGHEGGQIVFRRDDEHSVTQKEDDELLKVVVPYRVALDLKKVGVKTKSIFGYYGDPSSPMVKAFCGSERFLCWAYTYDELAALIPHEIEVDENTYLATDQGYDRLDSQDIEARYLHAEVTFQKTFVIDTPYMAICRCDGRMVAFSITEDGKYRNLIRWGINHADTAGQMLLALFEEKKVDVSN